MKTTLFLLVLAAIPLTTDGAIYAATKAEEPVGGVKQSDAAAAKKLLDDAAAKKSAAITILDIRTPEEFKNGHLAGAVNIDFNGAKFAEEIAKLDKSTTYLVHCQSGGRSTRSLPAFEKAGFKSLIHMHGGFAGWKKAGLPVEK